MACFQISSVYSAHEHQLDPAKRPPVVDEGTFFPGNTTKRGHVFLLCILLFGWFVSPSPAQGTPPLNASYFSASGVPLTTAGFDGSGQTVEFTLNFAPAMGTPLTVVNNTGSDFIENEFDNLANGEAVELEFNGEATATWPGISGRCLAWFRSLR